MSALSRVVGFVALFAASACEYDENLGRVLACEGGVCIDESIVRADAALPTTTIGSLVAIGRDVAGTFEGAVATTQGDGAAVTVTFSPDETALAGNLEIECPADGCGPFSILPLSTAYQLVGFDDEGYAYGYGTIDVPDGFLGLPVHGKLAFELTIVPEALLGDEMVLAISASRVSPIVVRATRVSES